jgi:hypothetical protein
MKHSRWFNNHNICQHFQSQTTRTLRASLLLGNWFRPWTQVIMRSWNKDTNVCRNYLSFCIHSYPCILLSQMLIDIKLFCQVYKILTVALRLKSHFMCISSSVYCRSQGVCNLWIIQLNPFCSYVTLQSENNGGKIRNSVRIIRDRKIEVEFPAGTWFSSAVRRPDRIEAHPSCCCLTANADFLLCFKAKVISHVHLAAKVMKEWM